MGSPRAHLDGTVRRAWQGLLEERVISLRKGSVINLETITTLFPPRECSSLLSHTYLFSHFLLPPPPLKHIMKLWKSHFLSKGSWLPRVTRVLSVPRVILLTETTAGGRGWRKEGGRRDKILHHSSLFSFRNGALQHVLGCQSEVPVSPAGLAWNMNLSEARPLGEDWVRK